MLVPSSIKLVAFKQSDLKIQQPGFGGLLTGVVNPKQPKVFGVKFSSREIEKVFPIQMRNFKLWKMPK